MNAAVRSYARSHGISPEEAQKVLFGDQTLEAYYALEREFDEAETIEDLARLEAKIQINWSTLPEAQRRKTLALVEKR